MWPYALSYLVALITFVAVDMVWLGTMASRFYKPIMGDIVASSINFPAAIAFYAIYPVGIAIFAINPALKSGAMTTAVTYGALFGFFAYATYNLTNHAIMRNWSVPLTLVDIAWGTVGTAVASAAGYWIVGRLAGNA